MASELNYLKLHTEFFVADSHMDTLSRLLVSQRPNLGRSPKGGGRACRTEMERLGMFVDVSHLNSNW